MNTLKSLMSDLEKSGVRRDGILMVHSSMKAIGETEGGADTVLDALCQYMSDGLLLLPTLSWTVVKMPEPYFDVDTTESLTGILPSIFRKREGVYRSCQPTHSVAGFGRDAVEYLEGEEMYDSPCNIKGAWGKLYTEKGQILMLGAPLTSTTFLHGVEEWAAIPGRLTAEGTTVKVKTHTGIHTGSYRSHVGAVSGKYGILRDGYIAGDFASCPKIGNADCWLFDAAGLCEYVTGELKKNPNLFSRDNIVK